MEKTNRVADIEKRSIRKLFYLGSVMVLLLTASMTVLPTFVTFRVEYDRKVKQLSDAIIEEKRYYMKSVIMEKISDIERIRHGIIKEHTELADTAVAMILMARAAQSPRDAYNAITDAFSPQGNAGLFSHLGYRIVDEATGAVLLSSRLSTEPAGDLSKMPVALRKISQEWDITVFLSEETLRLLTIEAAKTAIRETVLPDNGYIWVNHILDYDGGDDYAVRLVHPNLPETEGMLLSTSIEDIKGNRPYLEELMGIKADGETDLDYYFKKMDSDEISHKMTYARLYQPFDWVIATGVYLDDVDELIQRETVLMKESFRRQIGLLILVLSAAVVVAAFLIRMFESRLQTMIQTYEESVRESNEELAKVYKHIEDQAYLDFLTGLWNRRAMYEKMSVELSRVKRNRSVFCLIMGDVDHFKNINDTYGHDTGDGVLKNLAEILLSSVRREDCVSRWGGEEFLIMIPSAGLDQGMIIAEKIRKKVEESTVCCEDIRVTLTMTFGVSVFTDGKDLDEMVKEADEKLYEGKKAGRNRVVG